MTSISTEYFTLYKKYRDKYGDKVALLMQLGNFYNIFEYIPAHDPNPNQYFTENIGNAYEIGNINELNCETHIYAKSKPYSFENPYSIGFPMVAYDEKREILIRHGYIIIKYDQISTEIDKSTKRTKRAITEVESKHISFESNNPSNKIVSVYIENHKSNKKFEDISIISGLSYIDFKTGETGISEVYSSDKNKANALHEIYRAINSIKPKEVIINIGKYPFTKKEEINNYKNELLSALDLDNVPHVIYEDNIPAEYMKPAYHHEYFNRLYISRNNFIINELGLDRMYYGRISFILMIQTCYEHNKLIVSYIEKPTIQWLDEDKHLILTHNSIKQLDILPNEGQIEKNDKIKINSLYALMNKTNTPLGMRFLHNRICNPILDINELKNNYNMIEDFIKNKELIPDFSKYLGGIMDIQVLHRKMKLGVITPKEFSLLMKSYGNIERIYESIDKSSMKHISSLIDRDKLLEMIRCKSYVYSNINIDVLIKAKLSFVKTNIKCIELDWEPGYILCLSNEKDEHYYPLKMYEQYIAYYYNELKKIIEHCNILLNSKSVELKKHSLKSVKGYNEEISLITTKAQSNKLKQIYDGGYIDINLCGNIYFAKSGAKMQICSDIIDSHINNLSLCIEEYYKKIWNVFSLLTSNLLNYTYYDYLIEFISKLDFIISNAIIALKYNYFKPEINGGKSSFIIKDLRHPIAERLISNEYITNDVSLGLGSNVSFNEYDHNSPYGLLLYGINASGKTTLAKAIGCVIILAQAGCYVPCNLTFSPYKKIITRLSGNDNIFKGMSSFVIEMMELNTILNNADEYSLVIGDELCRGTEVRSAMSLTIGTIQELIDRKTTFIFSTHLHDLVNYDDINKFNDNQLRIAHLSFHYDSENDVSIYDRKLKDGSGNSNYGIDVAKSLHLNNNFINRVLSIRDRIYPNEADDMKNTLKMKQTKYNNEVWKGKCVQCGSYDNIHTHHIKEQHLANENGYIDHIHKNNKSNLIDLCESCHTKLHANDQERNVQQTINGKIIEISDNPNNMLKGIMIP